VALVNAVCGGASAASLPTATLETLQARSNDTGEYQRAGLIVSLAATTGDYS
jgi:hypothetical protein